LKNKSHSVIAFILLGVLSVAFLTGCSSGSNNTASEGTPAESEILSESETESEETESESEPVTEETEESSSDTDLSVEETAAFVTSVGDNGLLTVNLASDGLDKPISDYTSLDRTRYTETGTSTDFNTADAELICMFVDGYFVEIAAEEIVEGDFLLISSVEGEDGSTSVNVFVYPEAEEGSDQ